MFFYLDVQNSIFNELLIGTTYKLHLEHMINNNTDRTLDVVFSRFRGFSFTITLRLEPKGVTRMLSFSVLSFNAACA